MKKLFKILFFIIVFGPGALAHAEIQFSAAEHSNIVYKQWENERLLHSAFDEREISYKLWELHELLPSLNVHVQNVSPEETSFKTNSDAGRDELLEGVVAALTANAGQETSPLAIPLSLREAMQIAVSSNKDVQLALLNPELASSDLGIAETVYDPTLFSDSRYYDIDRPIQSLLDTGSDGTTGDDSLLETGWVSRTGVRQPLPTGGYATLSYEADNLDSNSDLVIPNPQYTSRFKIELRQSLLKGIGDKSNKANIELADLGYSQAESEYRKSLSDVLKELAFYYWRYRYYHQLQLVSEDAVQAGEEILLRIKTKNEQGLANQLDLERAESALQDRKVQLVMDKKLSQTTLDQLKMVLGISPASVNFFAPILPTEPFINTASTPERTGLLKMALSRREEIAIARQSIKSATVKKKLAEHMRLPTLDARTSYALNGLGEEFNDSVDDSLAADQASWDVGVVLEWPIGGRKSSLELQKSILGERKAQIQYKKVLEKVAYEVNSTYSEVTLSSEEVNVAQKAQASYRKVLEHEKTLFDMSRISNQRIMDSQDDYYEAERSYTRALLNLNMSLLKLQWVQGILLENFEIGT